MCKVCGSDVVEGARFCGACGRATMVDSGVPRRILRSREGKMIAGVCAGIAAHYGWDVTLVRLVVVLSVLLGAGSMVIAYLIAWIVMPKAVVVYPTTYGPMQGGGVAA